MSSSRTRAKDFDRQMPVEILLHKDASFNANALSGENRAVKSMIYTASNLSDPPASLHVFDSTPAHAGRLRSDHNLGDSLTCDDERRHAKWRH